MSIASSFVLDVAVFAIARLRCAPLAAEPNQPTDVVVSDGADADDAPISTCRTVTPRSCSNSSRKLANPQQQFTSDVELQQYLDGVSMAISEASDKILAGEATDRQFDRRHRMENRIAANPPKAGRRGRRQENRRVPGRPEVRVPPDRRRGHRRDPPNRAPCSTNGADGQAPPMAAARRRPARSTTDWLINSIKSGKPIGRSRQPADDVLPTRCPIRRTARWPKKALDELLPLLRASDDPGVQQRLPLLEGVNRRLNLLGNKMELSGKFLDGNEARLGLVSRQSRARRLLGHLVRTVPRRSAERARKLPEVPRQGLRRGRHLARR